MERLVEKQVEGGLFGVLGLEVWWVSGTHLRTVAGLVGAILGCS